VWELSSCWLASTTTMAHRWCCIMVPLLTWCMISFKMSMGRSSSFSGPCAAFSFPFGAVTCSADVGAFTALGAGAFVHTPSSCPCIPRVCTSPCEGVNERARSASEGSGDMVLGVPGVESGESAMVLHKVRAARRHASSSGRRIRAGTALQCALAGA
jgi:hypothetical protein